MNPVLDIAFIMARADEISCRLTNPEDYGYGDDQAELAELMDELTDELAREDLAVDKLVCVLSTLSSKHLFYKEQAANLKSKADALAEQTDRLHSLLVSMVEAGTLPAKLTGSVYGISVCKNSRPSVVFPEEFTPRDKLDLPEQFLKVKTVVDVDKDAILDAFKKGELPEGFPATVVTGRHVRLR